MSPPPFRTSLRNEIFAFLVLARQCSASVDSPDVVLVGTVQGCWYGKLALREASTIATGIGYLWHAQLKIILAVSRRIHDIYMTVGVDVIALVSDRSGSMSDGACRTIVQQC